MIDKYVSKLAQVQYKLCTEANKKHEHLIGKKCMMKECFLSGFEARSYEIIFNGFAMHEGYLELDYYSTENPKERLFKKLLPIYKYDVKPID